MNTNDLDQLRNELAEKEKNNPAKKDTLDYLIDLILNKITPETKLLVGHKFPDDDTWLCLWMAKKFIPKTANAQIIFVNAGSSLPGMENDPSVLHFDTGKGEYDQHGKKLGETSSAAILAEKLGIADDPGLKPLVAMVTAVDNIKMFPPTAMHFIIEGLPRHPNYKNADGTINWGKVQERVFEFFDIVYGQETQRVQSRENLRQYAEWTTLPNDIKIASILWHPELREAAFEQGAAVVVWTQSRGKNGFYVGIQTNRQSKVRLGMVVATIRSAEGSIRGINIRGKNLAYLGRGEPVTNWFLHDSLKLILSGSRSWRLENWEYTRLSPRDIVGLVYQALKNIPANAI